MNLLKTGYCKTNIFRPFFYKDAPNASFFQMTQCNQRKRDTDMTVDKTEIKELISDKKSGNNHYLMDLSFLADYENASFVICTNPA